MAFKRLSSFEILCQPIVPGIPNVPYVQQGYFVQVTNVGGAAIHISLRYIPSPAFVAAVKSPVVSPFGVVPDAINLFADFIDNTGAATQYPTANFLAAPFGFKAATGPSIPAGATFLFGVQYLLNSGNATLTTGSGSTPQDTISARGLVEIEAPAGSHLVVLSTVRQVFNNYGSGGTLLDLSEGAYAPALIDGPSLNF